MSEQNQMFSAERKIEYLEWSIEQDKKEIELLKKELKRNEQ